MSIVHPIDLDGPAALTCAQSRCRECQDTLVRQHEGLVHVVLRRQSRGDVPYEDLLQAGRIAVWQTGGVALRPPTRGGILYLCRSGDTAAHMAGGKTG